MQIKSPYFFWPLLSSGSSQHSSFLSAGLFFPAAGKRWQVENEPVGWAIPSQIDTTMIAYTDWTAASHSRPGISVWTVMSQTCKSLPVIICFLSVGSFTMSKNTHAEEFAMQIQGSTGFYMFYLIIQVTIFCAYLTWGSSSVLWKIPFILPTQKVFASSATTLASSVSL